MRIRRVGRLYTVTYEHGKDKVGGTARRGQVRSQFVPESVHMRGPAGGYMEMLKARNY